LSFYLKGGTMLLLFKKQVFRQVLQIS